jgi:hypothetical protein
MGAYADCLARVWRVIEGCLYHRLRAVHGLEPSNLEASTNQIAMRRLLQLPRYASSSGDRVHRLTLGDIETHLSRGELKDE